MIIIFKYEVYFDFIWTNLVELNDIWLNLAKLDTGMHLPKLIYSILWNEIKSDHIRPKWY